MSQIHKSYATTPAGQLHYRTTSHARDGVPVVLLHQTASSSIMFETIMLHLADRFTVIAPDTPGFGNSFTLTTSPTIKLYARAIYEALHSLHITECFLFGHHTGAAIAVQIAHEHPEFVRKIILSGPPLLNAEQKQMLSARLKPMEIKEDGSHLAEIFQRIRGRAPHAALALINRETLLTAHAADFYHRTYHAVFAHDFAGQLKSLTQPIMVMCGDQDTLRDSLEPSYALLQNGTMKIIPDANTYICDLQPKLVADLMCEFFVLN